MTPEAIYGFLRGADQPAELKQRKIAVVSSKVACAIVVTMTATSFQPGYNNILYTLCFPSKTEFWSVFWRDFSASITLKHISEKKKIGPYAAP